MSPSGETKGGRHDDLLKTPSAAQHNHSKARLASEIEGLPLHDTCSPTALETTKDCVFTSLQTLLCVRGDFIMKPVETCLRFCN